MTTTSDRRHGAARSLTPGLLLAGAGTAASFAVGTAVPAVSALTVAVVLGVGAGPFLPASARDGLAWATRRFLRLGVVLLGLQLGLAQVAGLGSWPPPPRRVRRPYRSPWS